MTGQVSMKSSNRRTAGSRGWNGEILQWRNVISRGPQFKIFEGPLVEVPKARVERRICTSFLGVQGMLTRKIFESRVSEMPFHGLWGGGGGDFTEFWWSENDIVTYQRPWPMFLLYRQSLGAPIWVGVPRVLPVWAHSSYATEILWRDVRRH
jgi:hypothetical protein